MLGSVALGWVHYVSRQENDRNPDAETCQETAPENQNSGFGTQRGRADAEPLA